MALALRILAGLLRILEGLGFRDLCKLVCIQGMEFSQDLGFGVRGLDRRQ